MKRILAIHAHPDDLEILLGGTLALLAAAGHSVTMATMTAGDCGSAERTSREISQIRLTEARASAALIHAEYVCCGFQDLNIFNTDPSRRRVTEILRSVRPDIVITASPTDYLADHEATSALVKDASFAAPVPLYGTGGGTPAPALGAIPHLYFMDPLTGLDNAGNAAIPDFGVDISAWFAIKRKMLEQHVSQREWLRKHHGMDDYIHQMTVSTRETGARFGAEYGEGLRQYRGHAYPHSPLLQEMLGGNLRYT
ncbi:MAG: PIG-L family deacetylase [Acidobacteriota bacterium]|nr:PIG-L family deacetylase [Acidobacteriota bacterium]